MSDAANDPLQIALIGATGLVGRMVMEAVIGREDVRLTAIARREVPLPKGVRMDMIISKPGRWGDVLEEIKPRALICALGTTWKRAGKDEEAFRAVDQELVLNCAKVAKEKGIERFVIVTSVGANVGSRSLYLRVKGEVERDLAMLKFKRLDILHPGLLRGARVDDRRVGEGIAQALSPVMNVMMQGPLKDMRAIDARTVAAGALALACRKPGGRFTHNNDAIRRAARDWAVEE